jgi:endo-1,4-beta-xylanase
MLKRGVPLHGIGHQMHISLDEPGLPEIDETLSTFSRLGLENQITELDISLYPRHAYFLPDLQDVLEARQAARYQALMTLVLAHPEVSAVTWWGVSDGHTWLNEYENWWRRDRPLLFDAQGQAKASYWAVLRAAREMLNP